MANIYTSCFIYNITSNKIVTKKSVITECKGKKEKMRVF